jgi:hypothetical protein
MAGLFLGGIFSHLICNTLDKTFDKTSQKNLNSRYDIVDIVDSDDETIQTHSHKDSCCREPKGVPEAVLPIATSKEASKKKQEKVSHNASESHNSKE